ncbi:hypothetical protein ABPG75_007274 [Micractinium tetrahymenae]
MLARNSTRAASQLGATAGLFGCLKEMMSRTGACSATATTAVAPSAASARAGSLPPGGAAPFSAEATGQPPHVIDQNETIVGSQTPVTKRLWLQRYRWTDERLAAARPRDARAAQPAKPPNRTTVRYSFASDPVLREHYRNPWGSVRIGRILEDLDSLAGLVAFDHCDDGNPSTRPPLLVTATVEAIQLRSSQLTLEEGMELSGRVVWTGSSSMDIRIELEQGGQQQLTALFTFVARDPLTLKSTAITAVQSDSEQVGSCSAGCVQLRWCWVAQRAAAVILLVWRPSHVPNAFCCPK